MRKEISNKKGNVIKAFFEEYRALREEQKTRLIMNSTIINVIVLIIGGELAAYVQMVVSHNTQYFASLIIVSPILTTPLISFYYDNSFMLNRIGRYFIITLYPQIAKLIGPNIFGWEAFHQSTSGQLWLVAFGRNIFFVLITIAPALIFLLLKLDRNDLSLITIYHPIVAWQFICDKIGLWEKWVLLVDLLLLIIVIATWFHSGLYFLGKGGLIRLFINKK